MTKPKICLTKSEYDLLNQNRKLRNIMCRQSRKKCLEQSENSPLKKADDAVEIDNSNLTREDQKKIAINLALDKINNIG